jgi:hypothetical protein
VRSCLLGLVDLGDQQAPDESLKAFAERPLLESFADLVLDARYEKVREAGIVMSQAVLIAVGIDWDGRRQILAVEMANRDAAVADLFAGYVDALKSAGKPSWKETEKGLNKIANTTTVVERRFGIAS